MNAVVDVLIQTRHICAAGLLLFGLGFMLAGMVGMLRFPDLFTRLHALNLVHTFGAWLILGGLAAEAGDARLSVKFGILALALTILAPLATQALAQAGQAAGLSPLTGRLAARNLPRRAPRSVAEARR